MKILKPAFACLIMVLSTACTSTPSEACFTADWYERGASAARRGLPASEVLREEGQCAHYGVVPDHRRYVAGWRAATAR